MDVSSSAAVFAAHSDRGLIAAERDHRITDVEVAGTVEGMPRFFLGRHTRHWHEEFPILTQHGERVEVIDNVDLAPRVPVAAGDVVVVKGQFVPTPGGGIIHDTHHSPGPGWHRGGWIEWRGRRYE